MKGQNSPRGRQRELRSGMEERGCDAVEVGVREQAADGSCVDGWDALWQPEPGLLDGGVLVPWV